MTNCVCSARIFLYWKGYVRSYVLLGCFLTILLINMFNIIISLRFRSTRKLSGVILFAIMFFGNVLVATSYIIKLSVNITLNDMTCEYKIMMYIIHEFGTLTSGGSLLLIIVVNYILAGRKTFQTPRNKQQIFRRTLWLQLCIVVVNITVASSPPLIDSKIAFAIPICFQVMYSVGAIFLCFKINNIIKLATQNGTIVNRRTKNIKAGLKVIISMVVLTATLKTILVAIRVLWFTNAVDVYTPTLVWLKLSCYLAFVATPLLYMYKERLIFKRISLAIQQNESTGN